MKKFGVLVDIALDLRSQANPWERGVLRFGVAMIRLLWHIEPVRIVSIQSGNRVVVIMGCHLRESQTFVVLFAALAGIRQLAGWIEGAVQNVNLASSPQKLDQRFEQAREVVEVLDRAGDHDDIERTAAKWRAKDICDNPAQIAAGVKQSAALGEFLAVDVETDH